MNGVLEQSTICTGLLSKRATLPQGAGSIWRMAATSFDTVTQVPTMRWNDVEGDSSVVQRCRFAAFVLNLDCFDHKAFATSTAETSNIDPQQRQLLEHSYVIAHDAGLQRMELLGSGTAVYVGVASTEFGQIPRPASVYGIGGVGHCFAVGRISYVLGLQGPCVANNSACIRCQQVPSG